MYIFTYVAIARNVGDEAAQLMIHRSAWNESQLQLTKQSSLLTPSSLLSTPDIPITAPHVIPQTSHHHQSQCTPSSGIIEPEKFCQEMKALVNEVHSHGLYLGRISVGE